MNSNIISKVENPTAENGKVLDSKLEVEIGPITIRKRRRVFEHGMQETEDLKVEKRLRFRRR